MRGQRLTSAHGDADERLLRGLWGEFSPTCKGSAANPNASKPPLGCQDARTVPPLGGVLPGPALAPVPCVDSGAAHDHEVGVGAAVRMQRGIGDDHHHARVHARLERAVEFPVGAQVRDEVVIGHP